jgi:hypothetical protein
VKVVGSLAEAPPRQAQYRQAAADGSDRVRQVGHDGGQPSRGSLTPNLMQARHVRGKLSCFPALSKKANPLPWPLTKLRTQPHRLPCRLHKRHTVNGPGIAAALRSAVRDREPFGGTAR